MQFQLGAKTDVGRKRKQNQDSFFADVTQGLFIVADGMGGHQGGETASAMAVEVIPLQISKGLALIDSIQEANNAIYKKSMELPQLRGMGTTAVAMLYKNNLMHVGHVGDSRCYLYKGNALWQVTRDHSLIQEKLRAGIITREEAKTAPDKNVITRSVGFEPQAEIETYQIVPQKGDIFILCSDGLSGLVSDQQIKQIIETHLSQNKTMQETSDALVQQACDNGGDDNVTTICVKIE